MSIATVLKRRTQSYIWYEEEERNNAILRLYTRGVLPQILSQS